MMKGGCATAYPHYFKILKSQLFYKIGALSTINANRVKKKCPKPLRRVKYHDNQTDKTLNFLTNNDVISSQTLSDRYRY